MYIGLLAYLQSLKALIIKKKFFGMGLGLGFQLCFGDVTLQVLCRSLSQAHLLPVQGNYINSKY